MRLKTHCSNVACKANQGLRTTSLPSQISRQLYAKNTPHKATFLALSQAFVRSYCFVQTRTQLRAITTDTM